MAHTPGPWHVGEEKQDNEDCIIAESGKHVVCSGHEYDQCGIIGQRADAALIAAAPDFYEAAVVMLAAHDQHARECNFTRCGCEECKMFRPIVAKAEGR